MKLQLVGCSHHNSPVELRERLAFSPEQTRDALAVLRQRFPSSEAVLLSTCNRIELYTASEDVRAAPSHHDVIAFLAEFHGMTAADIFDMLYEYTGVDAVRHLFTVAASLDSMVVGEAQILGQVKEAYRLASEDDSAGPLTHAAFQAAMRVAKRVATETAIGQRRISVPSVAVADFARQIFERFDDKKVLVIGAGEMGGDTLRHLREEGARHVTVISRDRDTAQRMAEEHGGKAASWDRLDDLLIAADLVISTTAATEPVVSLQRYKQIEPRRFQRTLFVLDLAVPRDFDPAIGDRMGVYLYSLDDLRGVCKANQKRREKEWPKADRIVEDETARFMSELHHRATGPTIRRLKEHAETLKQIELLRLWQKLDGLDSADRREIEHAVNRLVNKLLHPPLESLRDQSGTGPPHGLLEALKQLFRLQD